MPTKEQQRARRNELVARQRIAVFVFEQQTDEVVFWIFFKLVDEFQQIVLEFHHSARCAAETIGVVVCTKDQRGNEIRPLFEQMTVNRWHSQHLRNHNGRQWCGKGLHNVNRNPYREFCDE